MTEPQRQETGQVYMPKLSEGWLYVTISPETWNLLSHFGDQEKTPDEGLKEALKIASHSSIQKSDAVLEHALEFIDGRLEGLQILLDIPETGETMTDKELRHVIFEIEIIRDCLKIARTYEQSQDNKTTC